MVCKKDVVTWFKGLKTHKRIEVMSSLLHLCHPFELRFLGTCIEELGKRDFQELRQTENEANSPLEVADLQSLASQRARTKLALYVSLLYSCNYACSNAIFNVLANSDDVNSLLKPNVLTQEVLDDLLSVYTLALNHPAFSYEQKLALEKIFDRLTDEELRFYEQSVVSRTKQNFTPLHHETLHDKPPPLQSYQSCISMDEAHLIGVNNTGQCPPMPSPHLTVTTGMFCGGEHLVNVHEVGGMRVGFGGGPAMMGGWAAGGEVSSASPLVGSRTSSPCQSNSASRPNTPPHQQRLKTTFPPPRVPPPPPHDSLRETIGKEMPTYITSLQNYNPDQLSRMSDDELRDKGLPQSAIIQLRSILSKQVPTNGIGPTSIDMNIKKKVEPHDPEYFVQGLGRRFGPLEGMPVYSVGPPGLMCPPACYTCVLPSSGGRQSKCAPHHHPHQPHIVGYPALDHQLRAFRIDADSTSFQGSNSSSSDTASDHSPPDTPGPPHPPSHLGGLVSGEMVCGLGGGESNREAADERRGTGGGTGHPRPRGIGRNRANPPGIQTLPRGRGPNPAHRRRDVGSNVANGGVEERKVFGGDSGGGGGGFYPGGGGGGGGGGYMGGGYMRGGYAVAAAAFSAGSGFVRPYPGAAAAAFHQPNGELVYQYPAPPAQAFVAPPPPPPYSTPPLIPPPPKISCYNCGNQSHVAADCPDATIEEVTKQGQYRIDYSSYQKLGSGGGAASPGSSTPGAGSVSSASSDK